MFSDRDLNTDPAAVETALKNVQVFFGSLIFDYDQWLIIYGYWNTGGSDNVAAMFWTIAERYLDLKVGAIPSPIETPNMGWRCIMGISKLGETRCSVQSASNSGMCHSLNKHS